MSAPIMLLEAPRPKLVTYRQNAVAYRPDIDGLRTIAVIPVVLYHAAVAPFRGGFVGVDVFFVISGYLIMATLEGDIRLGRFSILEFYERRIRRIFPALFAMLLFCVAAAAIAFPPDAFERFGQSTVAVALFVGNIFFRFDGGPAGYFDTASDVQLLLHTWSLAVEEQFYIFLPIFLMLMGRRDKKITMAFLVFFSAASFALSVWDVAYRPQDAFYLVFPRAWELLIGCLLAIEVVPPLTSRRTREAASLLGLGLIAVAVFAFSKQTKFPGANALLPCLGAWLIIYAGETGATWVGTLLASRPFVFVGKRSYSLYLWHWPFVVMIKSLDTGLLNAPSTVLIVVSSFVASCVSYSFIEQPFRGRRALLTRKTVLASGLAVSLAAVLVGIAVVASEGFPQRYDTSIRTVIAANIARENDRLFEDCENWRADARDFDGIRSCPLSGRAKQSILFWGDSHMGVLMPQIRKLFEQDALGGRGVIFAISAGCPPAPSLNRREGGYHCNGFSSLALQRAKEQDIQTVFIAFSTGWDEANGELCLVEDGHCVRKLSRAQAEDTFIKDLGESVRQLKAWGKQVIISLPLPTYNLMIPQMEINAITLGRFYTTPRDAGLLRSLKRSDSSFLRERLLRTARDSGARIYDPRESLCKGGSCVYQRDHISLYIDNNHIAASQTGIFHDSLRDVLR